MRLNLYKVGDIIHTRESTNPSNRYVGTWELIGQGKVMVGVDPNDADFNTVGKTGGEKTHKLKVEEIPNHPHSLQMAGTRLDANGDFIFRMQAGVGGNGGNFWNLGLARTGNGSHDASITSHCGDKAHNNVQPYETCYIWCRTA